jgi:hypothetical protein
MIRLLITAVLALTMTVAAHADVSTNGLTEIQKAELALNAAQMKATGGVTQVGGVLAQLSKFEGIGKETGVAIREGLLAVTDVANKFGETNVGQITIALIVWRIAGKDLINILIGFVGLFVGIWFYRKASANSVTVTKYKDSPVLFGLWARQIPAEWDTTEAGNESKVAGLIGVAVGTLIFVVALGNL